MSENSPLANSFKTRRSGKNNGTLGNGRQEASGQEREPARKRRRKKVGKRSNSQYAQALGYVRRGVHSRVIRTLTDPEVVGDLITELDERGIEHKPGKVDYGALVELWSLEWLEAVGYPMED